jgi:hypothetical protein
MKKRKFGVPVYSIVEEVTGDGLVLTIERRVEHDARTFSLERRAYFISAAGVRRIAKKLGIIGKSKR